MGQAIPATGRSILIVEDEAFIRHDLSDFFEDAGFRVFEAENADDAIDILESNAAISVVLTDIQMPGSIDGIKLAHHVRNRYPPTLLVIASGAVRPAPADLPKDAMFIPKPFDPRFVLNAIRQAGIQG